MILAAGSLQPGGTSPSKQREVCEESLAEGEEEDDQRRYNRIQDTLELGRLHSLTKPRKSIYTKVAY
jgi:hypothetical protein